MNTKGVNLFFTGNSSNDFDNAGYPNKYFYVPKGTTEIAFFDGEPEGTNGRGYLFTPDGVMLHRTKTTAKDIYTVSVPAGQDGKLWLANIGHSGFNLVNIPNVLSLQKFSYNENINR
jgi:hypothetical protein